MQLIFATWHDVHQNFVRRIRIILKVHDWRPDPGWKPLEAVGAFSRTGRAVNEKIFTLMRKRAQAEKRPTWAARACREARQLFSPTLNNFLSHPHYPALAPCPSCAMSVTLSLCLSLTFCLSVCLLVQTALRVCVHQIAFFSERRENYFFAVARPMNSLPLTELCTSHADRRCCNRIHFKVLRLQQNQFQNVVDAAGGETLWRSIVWMWTCVNGTMQQRVTDWLGEWRATVTNVLVETCF